MSTNTVGALKALCLTWVCDLSQPRGYSIALCMETVRYSNMIMLQMVSRAAEVLVVGQTNIAVICTSCWESTWGSCHLQIGSKSQILFPLQLRAAQGSPIGSQNKTGTSKLRRCRRMNCVLSAPECQIQSYTGIKCVRSWETEAKR